MLFVFNKNKIISYTIAASVVAILFIFSVSLIPNPDTQLIQVSTNVTNKINNNIQNNNVKKDNTYNN